MRYSDHIGVKTETCLLCGSPKADPPVCTLCHVLFSILRPVSLLHAPSPDTGTEGKADKAATVIWDLESEGVEFQEEVTRWSLWLCATRWEHNICENLCQEIPRAAPDPRYSKDWF